MLCHLCTTFLIDGLINELSNYERNNDLEMQLLAYLNA